MEGNWKECVREVWVQVGQQPQRSSAVYELLEGRQGSRLGPLLLPAARKVSPYSCPVRWSGCEFCLEEGETPFSGSLLEVTASPSWIESED